MVDLVFVGGCLVVLGCVCLRGGCCFLGFCGVWFCVCWAIVSDMIDCGFGYVICVGFDC